MKFSEAAEVWLENDQRIRPWSDKYYRDNRQIVKSLLIYLDDMNLEDMAAPGVLQKKYMQILEEKWLKPRSLQRYHSVVRAVLHMYGFHQPEVWIRDPKPRHAGQAGIWINPSTIPNKEDVFNMRVALEGEDPTYLPYFDASAYSGLRLGEAAALPMQLIRENSIEVVSQITTNGTVKLPKGEKVRETFIPSFSEVRDFEPGVKRHNLTQALNRARNLAGGGWTDCDDSGRKTQWRWTWHDLRHFFCTWAINDLNIPPSDVSAFAGHSSVAFTLDRYVGNLRGSVDRAVELSQKGQW